MSCRKLGSLCLLVALSLPVLLAPRPAVVDASQARAIVIPLAANDFPSTLNPVSAGAAGGNVALAIDRLLFRSLTTIDFRGHVRPDLLARLPSVANGGILDGGRTVLFQLRPHQYWSSGAEITARDVVFGYRIGRTGDAGTRLCQARCGFLTSIRVRSRYVAVATLRPSAAAPDETLSLLPLLPDVFPHHWARLGRTPGTVLRTITAGTITYLDPTDWTDGPFRVASVIPGQQIVLQRVPTYRGPLSVLELPDGTHAGGIEMINEINLTGVSTITFTFSSSP